MVSQRVRGVPSPVKNDPTNIELPTSATAERWVIVLVAEPGEVPAARRVAQVFKIAKRRHGLRCIEVSDRTPAEQLERARAEILELRHRLDQAEARSQRSTRPKRGRVAASTGGVP